MRLIYLHGPPASGKYTIACELQARIGARNLHNHLTLDVAEALLEFDGPGFWDLVAALRKACLGAVVQRPDLTVVTTQCYSHPEDRAEVAAMEETVTSAGGRFLPVFLECDRAELENRVVSPARATMGKLQSVDGLRAAVARWNLVKLPSPATVTVTTTGRRPAECATEIIERLGLEAG